MINREKSQPEATQSIEFLGFMVNSVSMTSTLPTAMVKEVKSKCKQALQAGEVNDTPLALAHIIGVLTSTHLTILPVPPHNGGLQA